MHVVVKLYTLQRVKITCCNVFNILAEQKQLLKIIWRDYLIINIETTHYWVAFQKFCTFNILAEQK